MATQIRTMKVDTTDGIRRSVEVIPEELVRWLRADRLEVIGDERQLRLTGELWTGTPLHGDSIALVERQYVKDGEGRSSFSIGRWVR